jgi:hypothetical protein
VRTSQKKKKKKKKKNRGRHSNEVVPHPSTATNPNTLSIHLLSLAAKQLVELQNGGGE